MVAVYFSGTGNTKFIAKQFGEKLHCKSYSIEADVDFAKLLSKEDCICVAYPIYDSRVPRIFKEFALKHKSLLKGKKIVILVTQMFFSGDGARAFTDLFPDDYFEVIYAEHFDMPNNVCNIPLLWRVWVKNGQSNAAKLAKAKGKLARCCHNIQRGRVVKRGFNGFSKLLGLCQGGAAEKIDERGRGSVKTDSDCTGCGLCVKICPMKNLELNGKTMTQKNNCTLCYRCVNACPQRAITTLIGRKPQKQYRGINNNAIG